MMVTKQNGIRPASLLLLMIALPFAFGMAECSSQQVICSSRADLETIEKTIPENIVWAGQNPARVKQVAAWLESDVVPQLNEMANWLNKLVATKTDMPSESDFERYGISPEAEQVINGAIKHYQPILELTMYLQNYVNEVQGIAVAKNKDKLDSDLGERFFPKRNLRGPVATSKQKYQPPSTDALRDLLLMLGSRSKELEGTCARYHATQSSDAQEQARNAADGGFAKGLVGDLTGPANDTAKGAKTLAKVRI